MQIFIVRSCKTNGVFDILYSLPKAEKLKNTLELDVKNPRDDIEIISIEAPPVVSEDILFYRKSIEETEKLRTALGETIKSARHWDDNDKFLIREQIAFANRWLSYIKEQLDNCRDFILHN